jgi:hypothetical protein
MLGNIALKLGHYLFSGHGPPSLRSLMRWQKFQAERRISWPVSATMR